MTKRLVVDVLKLNSQKNGRDALTLKFGGLEFRLMGDHSDPAVRAMMAALYRAHSVELLVEEHSQFQVP